MGSTREFPALGFDPAPGDAGAVESAADALTSGGSKVAEAHETASGLNIGDAWSGTAADKAKSQFDQLPQQLDDTRTTMQSAGKVLGQWAGDLKGYQSQADSLESDAKQAKQQLETAQAHPDLKLAGQTFTSEQAAQDAQQRYQSAANGVKQATSNLDGIKQQATKLQQQHQQTATDVAKALNGKSNAQSTGPKHDPPMQQDNGLGSKISSLALANKGKGAGWCSVSNSSPNSLGGNSFGTSCNVSDNGHGEYWCADFAKWTWANSGANVTGLSSAAGSFYTYGQQHNTLHTDNPKVGDAVVVGANGKGYADHVGVVTNVNPDGSIQVANGDWNGQDGTQAHFAQTSTVVVETWKKGSDGQMRDSDGRLVSGYVSPAGS